jgi:hypothetical protein
MSSAGFEPETPAIEGAQTYALDRAAKGIGQAYKLQVFIFETQYLPNLFSNTVFRVHYTNISCSHNWDMSQLNS